MRQVIGGNSWILSNLSRCAGSAPDGEELLENCGGIFRKNARSRRDAVIELGMMQHGKAGTHSAGLGVVRSVNESADACLNHGATAHSARLDGYVESCAEQPIISNDLRRGAQRDDFCVRGRVAIRDRAITRARDDATVPRQHRANGNFATLRSFAGFGQRCAHEFGVGGIFWHATSE
jgi:hypothetical protein